MQGWKYPLPESSSLKQKEHIQFLFFRSNTVAAVPADKLFKADSAGSQLSGKWRSDESYPHSVDCFGLHHPASLAELVLTWWE